MNFLRALVGRVCSVLLVGFEPAIGGLSGLRPWAVGKFLRPRYGGETKWQRAENVPGRAKRLNS